EASFPSSVVMARFRPAFLRQRANRHPHLTVVRGHEVSDKVTKLFGDPVVPRVEYGKRGRQFVAEVSATLLRHPVVSSPHLIRGLGYNATATPAIGPLTAPDRLALSIDDLAIVDRILENVMRLAPVMPSSRFVERVGFMVQEWQPG